MEIYGIHPAFLHYFLVGAGLCSIGVFIGTIGIIIYFINLRKRHLIRENNNTGNRPNTVHLTISISV